VVVRRSGESIAFEIDETRRRALLEGLDEIGQTLGHAAAIDQYESARRVAQPWLPAVSVG
jgi:3-isopropylmalate/(R)-2-methylmalate dehydratase small subunit